MISSIKDVAYTISIISVDCFFFCIHLGICPSSWTHFQGSCFKIVTKTLTWKAAKSACEALGSKLAVVKSRAENQAITTRLWQIPAWIGLYRDPKDNSRWLWIDGSRPSYTNWDRGQPQKSERCVAIYASGLWHDWTCNSNSVPSFFCETIGKSINHLKAMTTHEPTTFVLTVRTLQPGVMVSCEIVGPEYK